VALLFVGAGGCSNEAGRDSGTSGVRRPDLLSVLRAKPSVLRAKPAVRVGRDPVGMQVEKVLDAKEAVRGYVQERYYTVLEGEERSEARIVVVLDDQWHRRGFVTETGAAYRYDAKGGPVPLPATGFVECVKAMLDIEDTISFVAYSPDEEKKPDGGVEGGEPAPAPKEQ
jgi:hypothetical protein